METNRFMQIMVMELTSDILKAEAALEKTINSDVSLESKISEAKHQLSNLLLAENKLAKFNSMFRSEETETETQK
jgi:hypothetical protein